nr:hypothetical protein [Tanacetum cinerariifolium]
MSQFVQISHTHQYVVPFHTKKLFTTLRVNSPSFSGRIVPLFDTMLVHHGEGSGTPTEATIAKPSNLPHDSAPRVTSPAADEGKEEIVKLKDRVKVLEDKKDVAATQSGDDAPIKRRSINEGEAAAERISNDLEEVARVLTSIDAATVLAGGIDVPTGSGFIPTVGPPTTVVSTGSEVGPTASPIVTRRKGKEVLVESDTPKKKKLQKQIDAQLARELEEQQEKENFRMNKQIARDA